jgi:hypothetical protein
LVELAIKLEDETHRELAASFANEARVAALRAAAVQIALSSLALAEWSKSMQIGSLPIAWS